MDPRPDVEALERARDRRRRWADALRLVPVFGAAVFLLPLLLAGDAGWSTATIGLFVFIGWAGLIAVVGVLSRRGGPAEGGEREEPAPPRQRAPR